jgi:putative transposase
MPWHETCVMDERMAFIVDWQRDETSLAALCRRYGVSRKTGYKWLDRFEADGMDGLKDRSCAANRHPNVIEAAATEAVIAARMQHPSWGPKKIKAWLSMKRRVTTGGKAHFDLEEMSRKAVFDYAGVERSSRPSRVRFRRAVSDRS